MRFFAIFGVMCISALMLSGCALGVAAGAVAGASAAQEGGISRAVSDAKIQAEINDLWFRSNVDMFRKLDLTVTQGRVLITGVVQDPENRVEAVRLAWKPLGVSQVINEIAIAESGGIVVAAKDTWIITRLRAAITIDENITSLNYSIDAVHGTIYLMGVAQDQEELNRVIAHGQTIDGVNRVVSYVKLSGGKPDPQEWQEQRAQNQDQ